MRTLRRRNSDAERESSLLLYVAPALRPRGGGRAGGMKYLVNGEDSAQ